MSTKSNIEALLFAAGRPLTTKKIAELVEEKEDVVLSFLNELQSERTEGEGGLRIFSQGRDWQMGTAPEAAAVIEKFVKQEFAGELTRPQLEALTVIAYRGPISKGELEIIRGVSCSLILRNLMIRGLVDEESDPVRKEPRFRISMDFLRYLGISSLKELPDYEKLHGHEVIQTLLAPPPPAPTPTQIIPSVD